ncbi:PREDICTED: uncharacterized protein LOC109289026 isoform X3 [Gavialis gangeticus]|uniref:uncharacterized protein LOC109289026 isoform X3 n=1 Tax=Gavialis gangeticus TaxID=94835 RepID=UPI00092EE71F|nr:PREDICTED: uncharacterized protein LOC109289026 isoform X3 [Gavialis gangeticus]
MGEAGAGSLGPGQRRRRKLVLHVDVNNTVVVADAVTGQGPRAALNAFLSAAAWGRRAPDGAWQWLSEVPSLRPPCPGAVSYSSAHGRDPHFADSPQGSRFQGVLRQHLRLLAWPGAPHEGLSVRGEGGRRYHLVLPAFLRLLDTLHRDGRRFAVVFRTFGTDLPCVLRALRCALQGQHPGFPALRGLPLPVDASVGRIRCSEQEVVLCRGHTRLSTQDNARALYSFFSAAEGLSGFQDHFDWVGSPCGLTPTTLTSTTSASMTTSGWMIQTRLSAPRCFQSQGAAASGWHPLQSCMVCAWCRPTCWRPSRTRTTSSAV